MSDNAGFIVAAYAIVWGALSVYILTLRVRH
jgi:hypothetical protein